MNPTLPAAGSKAPCDAITRAADYGIDISLLEENLQLSPAERLRRHDQALNFSEELRAAKLGKVAQ